MPGFSRYAEYIKLTLQRDQLAALAALAALALLTLAWSVGVNIPHWRKQAAFALVGVYYVSLVALAAALLLTPSD